ncbi:hypothetical protein KEH51_08345 [[Brevibacterium] frigoritolerans]|uniref:Uncharacterized protein n=1 Tax=Peribacillus frigoritolerans TaxID=450367 RepID=A0A941FQY8_9BACI|nr:hypothetical protein [Peribacillus frigoritolerans]
MKTEDEKTSEGLNEIFEIINAKGDIGELKEIIQNLMNKQMKTSKPRGEISFSQFVDKRKFRMVHS